jgi:hypothetical protein
VIPDAVTSQRHAILPDRETETSRRLLRMFEKWVHVGLEYFEDWPQRPNSGHFFGGVHWYGEDTCIPSLAFAAAASSPELDENAAGCSREELRAIALKGIRYLCFTHDTGPADCVRPDVGLGRPEICGTKWGERGAGFFRESQCGRNMAILTTTAMLLGETVDDETWSMLAAVNADYAARFGRMDPRCGVYDDTQTEENAWTAVGLASAALLLANHPDADGWEANARRWMFSTAITPQDAKNLGPMNDETVRLAIRGNFTMLPDYMAENHGMVHPTYTASALTFTGNLGCLYGLFGRELPSEALFNRQRVYDQLKRMTDAHGEHHPVQGMDWPYLFPINAMKSHVTAALILGDPDGAYFAAKGLLSAECRQASYGGRLLDREIAETCHDIQDPMVLRENAMGRAVFPYLLYRLYGRGPEPTPESEISSKLDGVKVYPHSGFVHHRHGKGMTSFSWRNSVMALPLTSDGIYTVAPASGSMLGMVEVRDRPDSQDLIGVHVDEHADRFAAAMAMDRAQGTLRQEVLYAGLPSGASISWERFTAKEDITVTSVRQGFLRIINERLDAFEGNCNGRRTLYHPGGEDVFTGGVSTDPTSDVVRTYDREAWLNVDDRLGIVFNGRGTTTYCNRHYYDTWWAVADDLVLSGVDGEHEVRSGRVAAELAALVAPDQTHDLTARQSFSVLKGAEHTTAFMADGYFAAANFGPKHRNCRFAVGRDKLGAIPIIEGRTIISDGTVTYVVPLEAMQASLRPVSIHIRADGDLEATGTPTGEVFLRNPTEQTVTVNTGRRSVPVAPDTVIIL